MLSVSGASEPGVSRTLSPYSVARVDIENALPRGKMKKGAAFQVASFIFLYVVTRAFVRVYRNDRIASHTSVPPAVVAISLFAIIWGAIKQYAPVSRFPFDGVDS